MPESYIHKPNTLRYTYTYKPTEEDKAFQQLGGRGDAAILYAILYYYVIYLKLQLVYTVIYYMSSYNVPHAYYNYNTCTYYNHIYT